MIRATKILLTFLLIVDRPVFTASTPRDDTYTSENDPRRDFISLKTAFTPKGWPFMATEQVKSHFWVIQTNRESHSSLRMCSQTLKTAVARPPQRAEQSPSARVLRVIFTPRCLWKTPLEFEVDEDRFALMGEITFETRAYSRAGNWSEVEILTVAPAQNTFEEPLSSGSSMFFLMALPVFLLPNQRLQNLPRRQCPLGVLHLGDPSEVSWSSHGYARPNRRFPSRTICRDPLERNEIPSIIC